MVTANLLDQDGDGFSDLDETLLTLTDPTDSNSRFDVNFVSSSEIFFSSIANRRYTLERSFSLEDESWVDIEQKSVSQANASESFSIVIEPGQPRAFYRIRIERE